MLRISLVILIAFLAFPLFAQPSQQLDLLVRAERTLAEGDTAQALDQFQEILQRYPQNYAAIVRLAEINFASKQFDKSSQYIYLAIDVIDKFIDQLEKDSNVVPSPKDQDLRDRYNRDLADLYHLLGLIRNRKGEYDKAREAFEKSITLNTTSAVMVDLALTHLRENDFKKAVEAFHSAINLDPTAYKPYYNLATAYHQAKVYDSALHYYEKTVELNTKLPWPHLYKGQIYTSQGQFEKAISSLSSFIALDSTKTAPYFRRALLYVEQAQFEKALRDWNKVLEMGAQNADALRNRALTYFYLENYEKAIVDFDAALALNEEPYSLINRGYSYYLIGEPEKALVDLNKGLGVLSKYALGHYIRALTYLKLKKKKKACADLKKALELGFNENEVDGKLMRKCF